MIVKKIIILYLRLRIFSYIVYHIDFINFDTCKDLILNKQFPYFQVDKIVLCVLICKENYQKKYRKMWIWWLEMSLRNKSSDKSKTAEKHLKNMFLSRMSLKRKMKHNFK